MINQKEDFSLRECKSRDVLLSTLFKGTKHENKVDQLQKHSCCSALELIVHSEALKNFSVQDRDEMLQMCGELFSPSMEKCGEMEVPPSISWGCDILDPIFGGGIFMKGIVEIAGEAGSGKSQNCLWLMMQLLSKQSDCSAIYVSTEGEFPSKRFRQFCVDKESIESRVVLEKASSFDELWTLLTTRIPILLVKLNVKLLIIDSIGALRSEYDLQINERSDHLWKLSQYLKWMNDRYCCGVLVTNHVRANFEGEKENSLTPALGLVWTTCVNTRLILKKSMSKLSTDEIIREMKVEICPYLPLMSIPFIVTKDSIKGIEN